MAPKVVEMWVRSVAPTAISMWVRSPAHWPVHSRSAPTIPASRAASPILTAISSISLNGSRLGAGRRFLEAAGDQLAQLGVVPVGLAHELLDHLAADDQVGLRQLVGAVALGHVPVRVVEGHGPPVAEEDLGLLRLVGHRDHHEAEVVVV